MAQLGKPSIAHDYDTRDCCIHCGMYRCNVEKAAHVCKASREKFVDAQEAAKLGIDVEAYRHGGTPSGLQSEAKK